jgi:hypothetical protein
MSAARSNRNHVLKLTACAGPHPALSAPPRLLVQGRHNNPDLGERKHREHERATASVCGTVLCGAHVAWCGRGFLSERAAGGLSLNVCSRETRARAPGSGSKFG